MVIPKSAKKEHITSNIEIGDFKLEKDEVEMLNGLNIMYKTDWNPKDEL